MPTNQTSRYAAVTAMATGAVFGSWAAVAQEVPSQIEMIVPYNDGGGQSFYTRVISPALAAELPGNPTMVTRFIPGAGSVVGINEFHARGEPDGSIIGSLASGTFFNYVLGNEAVNYDLPAFRAILGSPFGVIVYGRTDYGLTGDPVADIARLTEEPPFYGGDAATAGSLPLLLSFELLGVKVQPVFGMTNAESRAGYERGEFQVNFDNMAAYVATVEPLFEEGSSVPLFTYGYEVDGEIVRDPIAPEIPTFLEVYEAVHGEELSGIEFDIWKALFDIRVMAAKMKVLPADTPDEIVQLYADAMERAVNSEAMQNDETAQQVLGPYKQVVGVEAANRLLQSAATMSDEQKDWLRAFLEREYDASF